MLVSFELKGSREEMTHVDESSSAVSKELVWCSNVHAVVAMQIC